MNSRNTSRPGPLAGVVIVVFIVAAFGLYQVFINTRRPELAIQTPSPTSWLTATPALTATPQPTGFRIIAPKANLSAPISEVYLDHTDNWDLTKLFKQAGHLQGTPFFGQGGNFVLAGHVEFKDGSKGPFADLDKLVKGDIITVLETQQSNPTIKNYVVIGVAKVQPDDFEVMRNHGYEEMTLITCGDWDSQNQTYLSRIVVQARPTNASDIVPNKSSS